MLVFGLLLLLREIATVNGVEQYNTEAEVQVIKTQLEALSQKFAAYVDYQGLAERPSVEVFLKALRSEKVERLKLASKVENQFGGLLEKFESLANHWKCGSNPNPNQRWIQHGDRCYYFDFEAVTWHKADEKCRSMQSHLVKIETEEENNFLVAQVVQQRVCYTQPTQYRGTINTTRSGIQCQRWDSHIPHRHMYDQGARFSDGSLFDAANYCRDPNNNYKPNKPWCYTVDSTKRFEECLVPMCSEPSEPVSILWIGLNDQIKEGKWTWATNQPLPVSNSFTNWDEQQPDNYKGNEDCVVMRVHSGGKWNDGPCGNHYGFICEALNF